MWSTFYFSFKSPAPQWALKQYLLNWEPTFHSLCWRHTNYSRVLFMYWLYYLLSIYYLPDIIEFFFFLKNPFILPIPARQMLLCPFSCCGFPWSDTGLYAGRTQLTSSMRTRTRKKSQTVPNSRFHPYFHSFSCPPNIFLENGTNWVRNFIFFP